MHRHKIKKNYLLLFLLLLPFQRLGATARTSKATLGMPDRDAELILIAYETAKEVYRSGDYDQAKSLLDKLKKSHLPPTLAPYIHFYYALAAYHHGETTTAKEAFIEIQIKFPDWHQQHEVYYWSAQCNFQEGHFAEALKALDFIKNNDMKPCITQMKQHFLKKIEDNTCLQELIEQFPQDSIIKNILHKKLAREAYFSEDFRRLEAFTQQYNCTGYVYNPLKKLTSVHKKSYNIAVMLPFFVEEWNYQICKDNFVIDLYQGIELAVEQLREEGNGINLFTFDTKRDKKVTETLLAEESMLYMDLIIGPLYPETIPLVAAFAKKHKINFVNPISDNGTMMESNPFAFLFQPDLKTCAQRAAAITLSNLSKQPTEETAIAVFYGLEEKEITQAITYKNKIEEALSKPIDFFVQLSNQEEIKAFFNKASQKEEAKHDQAEEINSSQTEEARLDLSKLTHIYVPSHNELIISNVISLCLKLGIKPQIIGHEEWLKKEILTIEHLKRLPILFLSPKYIDYSRFHLKIFRKNFLKKNSRQPNDQSYTGYEMMLFFGRTLKHYGAYFQKEWETMHYPGVIFQGVHYGKYHANQHIPLLRFVKDHFIVENSSSLFDFDT